MENKTKQFLLIDGNAIIHRSYHALPPLTTKKGEVVNAVYGFASTLLSAIAKFKPDYIIASFDLAAPTFRHKEFKEYKATRVKAPDELYNQIPLVKEIVKAFNIPIYEQEGYEADDIIGTLVKQAEISKETIENIIITGDLDTLQLASPKTKIYTMRRGISDAVLYDVAKVKERYGLSPHQLRDFKGLRGDPSDNIPGVKGIGEKTAISLLQEYGSLEEIYSALEEIKGAVKEKLERDKMQAIMSKKLGTIARDVPITLDLKSAATHKFDRKKVVDFFSELNFYSLIKRLPQNNSSEVAQTPAEASKREGVKDFKYEIITDEKIAGFLQELEEQKEISLAMEASAGKTLMAIAWKTGRANFLECSPVNLEKIKPVLENENVKKTGYDLKSIYKILYFCGISLRGISFDVMLAAYLLNSGSKIELKTIILTELGEEIEFQKLPKGQLALGIGEDPKNAIQRLCQKADYSLKLKGILADKIDRLDNEQKLEKLTERTIWHVFNAIEIPLVEILAQMEIQGIKINPLILKGISKKIEEKIKNLEKSIYASSGREFNINSPQQLAEILFKKLNLSSEDIKKTKTGFSTASAELEKLRPHHKIISKIETYRELFKLKTTYLDPLPLLADKDFRIHTTFNQAITATGRLSSTNPNLQNIPIKTDLGKLMRNAFVAGDGYKLISADYSQIDLRAVAHVSNDQKLIEAFFGGEDIHTITASQIYKITPSQVTEKMRRAAKTLNFGIIYGMSAFGFSQATGVEREEAQKFIDEYLEKFSGVAQYIKTTKEFAKKHGYVETALGRRRNIPEINSPNFQVANAGERMAINMPVQGLAADIMKIAMIKVYAEYKNNPEVKMVLQIHDEIILEAKEKISEPVAKKLKEIMENAYKLKIPLVVNVKVGDNWGVI